VVPQGAAQLLSSPQMQACLAAIAPHYDFVLLDSPSATAAPDAEALANLVDGIILIAALNRQTKRQLIEAKAIVASRPDKYYGLVVNCVERQEYRSYYPQESYYLPGKQR